MGFIKFLRSKAFLKHFGIAILVAVLILWLAIQSVDFYTNHGDEIEVPGLTGIKFDDLAAMKLDGDFEYVVIDSVYDEHFNKGEIVQQDPLSGSKVRRGRKIYVTTVATQPETVIMPDLVDLSLRQALNELKANSLKLDRLVYVPNFAKNAVLAQKFEGDTIFAGTEILKGTPIELVMGKGLNSERVTVPFLIGMTENDALNTLTHSSFNAGYLQYFDGRDKLHSRVYQQQPMGTDGRKADYGTHLDLWFRSDIYFNFDSLLQTFVADTIQLDTLNLKKDN